MQNKSCKVFPASVLIIPQPVTADIWHRLPKSPFTVDRDFEELRYLERATQSKVFFEETHFLFLLLKLDEAQEDDARSARPGVGEARVDESCDRVFQPSPSDALIQPLGTKVGGDTGDRCWF
jgi:hypothetical protein